MRSPSQIDRKCLLYFGSSVDAPTGHIEIPNRSLFRQPEVCEIAQVQPYVLRSWEAEFPDLGVAKTAGGPRVYRRADVERVLRIKHLLFVEGLTLAGARRKLQTSSPGAAGEAETLGELFGERRARADPAGGADAPRAGGDAGAAGRAGATGEPSSSCGAASHRGPGTSKASQAGPEAGRDARGGKATRQRKETVTSAPVTIGM